jgi:hypothetical protein
MMSPRPDVSFGLPEYIDSAKRALDAGIYPAALALCLTFPDICSQVKYGFGSTGEKYIDWCKEHAYIPYIDTYGYRNRHSDDANYLNYRDFP